MNPRLACSIHLLISFLGCQAGLSAGGLPAARADVVSFNDVRVEMESCEITPDRSATCRLRVTNRYTDKQIEVWRDIRIQDDLGSEYAVEAGGFGVSPPTTKTRLWTQLALADSSYPLTVVATNLSTRATSVRAVVFQRFLAREPGGRALGYRDKVVFRSPPMQASSMHRHSPAGDSPGSGRPAVENGRLGDGWQDVGYWNYDATDGQSLGLGLVYRAQPGGGLGRSWPGHLELRNHASLPPRPRTLWPVRLHPGRRMICANYPNYPSYAVAVDLPGEEQDGTYQVARCPGTD